MRMLQLPARAVIAALLVVAGVMGASDGARALSETSRRLTFVDERNALAFTIQVDSAARDAGAFTFRVPGRGVYVGRAGPAMEVLSDSSVVVRYHGAATLRPLVRLDGSAGSPLFVPEGVTVELRAHIVPSQHIAEATLIHDTQRSHLVAPRTGKGDLLQVLRRYESATVDLDWEQLYTLVNTDLQAAYSLDAFRAEGEREIARVGRVASLRRLAVGDMQTADNGARYVLVGYELLIRQQGQADRLARFDVYFLRQADGWRLWASVPR